MGIVLACDNPRNKIHKGKHRRRRVKHVKRELLPGTAQVRRQRQFLDDPVLDIANVALYISDIANTSLDFGIVEMGKRPGLGC